jgi:hypothetical protein
MPRLTKSQKLLWNEAVRATMNEVFLYDGTIPELEDRMYLKTQVIKKLSYKIPIKVKK